MPLDDTDGGRNLDELVREMYSTFETSEATTGTDTDAVALVRAQQRLLRRLDRLLAQRIDALEAGNAEWEDIGTLRSRIEELEAEVEALDEHVDELGRRTRQPQP